MVAVGILVRVERGSTERVHARLARLAGVAPFALEESNSIGAVMHAGSVENAEVRLQQEITAIPGVLCAWPVHVQLESSDAVPNPNAV